MGLRKGRYLIRWSWFRVHWDGSFSKLEIDLGKWGGWELASYFVTNHRLIITRLNPSLKFLERRINSETGYVEV